METRVGITSDKVTPIHLCETLELVNKTLVSEYLLYFGNCADNATLTFSFHGKFNNSRQPLVENTEATTKSKPEALPVSKTSNGNNKQYANRSDPQKTVKMTNSDNNNTDKSQSSIDRFIRTPQRRRVPVNCETKYTETKRNELHRNETKFTETKRNLCETE